MNRPDFKKLLRELGAELGRSVEDVRQELAHAKSLRTRVVTYANETQALIDKFTDPEVGLASTIASAQELEGEITTLKTSADANLESITTSLSTVQARVEEMGNAYEEFLRINEKIDDEETGLEAILATSKSLQSDIEATKQTTETIFKEIGKLKDTAAGYTAQIESLGNSAKETLEKIVENHEQSEALRTKINQIFNISSRTAHANYFDDRRKALAKTSIGWLIAFVAFLALTLYLGYEYIAPLVRVIGKGQAQQVTNVAIEAFLVRLGLVSPALLSAIYCLEQFGHERRLYEQYAFRAISLLSVESSLQLLERALENTNRTDELDTRITLFAVRTLESIYSDPTESNKRSLLFKGGNKLLEISAGISQSVGEIKHDVEQVKENMPRDNK